MSGRLFKLYAFFDTIIFYTNRFLSKVKFTTTWHDLSADYSEVKTSRHNINERSHWHRINTFLLCCIQLFSIALTEHKCLEIATDLFQCKRLLRKECKKWKENTNQFQTAVQRLWAFSRAVPSASGANTQSCCCHEGIWSITSRASHLWPQRKTLYRSLLLHTVAKNADFLCHTCLSEEIYNSSEIALLVL